MLVKQTKYKKILGLDLASSLLQLKDCKDTHDYKSK